MPAGPSLQQILGYATLSKSIQLTTSGIPDLLPPKFHESHTQSVGPNVRWRQFTGERRVAKRVRYGAPAMEGELRDVGERSAKAIHFNEKITFDPTVFLQLQHPDSYEHDNGMYELQRQVTEFGRKFKNTRIAATILALRDGTLYFDSSDNLLPSSSGADTTRNVSFGINANNQAQLNSIITASWATASTDIVLQLRLLKKRAARLSGKPLKYAFYGENIPTYLMYNDTIENFLWRSDIVREDFLKSLRAGEIPDGLFGFTWIPMYESFFEDQNGTNQDLWLADQVTFCPEVDEDWWDVQEGSYYVPTTLNVQADATAAAKSLKTVHGMGAYGIVIHNPPTIQSYFFDTFMPLIKAPDNVYQADTTP